MYLDFLVPKSDKPLQHPNWSNLTQSVKDQLVRACLDADATSCPIMSAPPQRFMASVITGVSFAQSIGGCFKIRESEGDSVDALWTIGKTAFRMSLKSTKKKLFSIKTYDTSQSIVIFNIHGEESKWKWPSESPFDFMLVTGVEKGQGLDIVIVPEEKVHAGFFVKGGQARYKLRKEDCVEHITMTATQLKEYRKNHYLGVDDSDADKNLQEDMNVTTSKLLTRFATEILNAPRERISQLITVGTRKAP